MIGKLFSTSMIIALQVFEYNAEARADSEYPCIDECYFRGGNHMECLCIKEERTGWGPWKHKESVDVNVRKRNPHSTSCTYSNLDTDLPQCE